METFKSKVAEGELPKFITKFDKFKRNAEKIGVANPTWNIVGVEEKEEQTDRFGCLLTYKRIYKIFLIEIYYETPVIEGWRIVGNRERIGDTVFTKTVSSEEGLKEFHKSNTIKCDHCGTNRYRKKSILLKNSKSGNVIEVGNSCIKDFLGHMVSNLTWFVENPFEGEEFGDYGNCPFYMNLEKVLQITSFYVRKFGFQPGSQEGYVTRARVMDNFTKPEWRSTLYIKPEIGEMEELEAKETIEYFKNLSPEEYYSNEYITNLIKIVNMGDSFPEKLIGYTVSMISAYQKAMGREKAIAEEKEENAKSEHQGEIGDRLRDIPVTLTRHSGFDTHYGYTHVLGFKDDTGNIYVSFYSGNKNIPEIDTKLELTGTVKKHDTYKEAKQTILNRIIF